jgi:hypothetical protein
LRVPRLRHVAESRLPRCIRPSTQACSRLHPSWLSRIRGAQGRHPHPVPPPELPRSRGTTRRNRRQPLIGVYCRRSFPAPVRRSVPLPQSCAAFARSRPRSERPLTLRLDGRRLAIPNGSLYNKEKLEQVSKRILELPYLQEVQPNDMTLLGTGSILNLYLAHKRSSQANFLIGFLPGAGQSGKLQLTADVNLDLKNALKNGETILFKWQQLQPKSPRLNIGFQQPYIFNSSFGFDFEYCRYLVP